MSLLGEDCYFFIILDFKGGNKDEDIALLIWNRLKTGPEFIELFKAFSFFFAFINSFSIRLLVLRLFFSESCMLMFWDRPGDLADSGTLLVCFRVLG